MEYIESTQAKDAPKQQTLRLKEKLTDAFSWLKAKSYSRKFGREYLLEE